MLVVFLEILGGLQRLINLWFKFFVEFGNVDECDNVYGKLVENRFNDVKVENVWLRLFFVQIFYNVSMRDVEEVNGYEEVIDCILFIIEFDVF